MRSKSNQGFALGSMLLAVVLMAAITTGIAYASRGSVGNATRESAVLQANTVVNQAVELQNALVRYSSSGYGNANDVSSMNDLINAGFIPSGFGTISGNTSLSNWQTSQEINDSDFGRYMQFQHGNFLVRTNASKELCKAIMATLSNNLGNGSVNTHDSTGNNSGGSGGAGSSGGGGGGVSAQEQNTNSACAIDINHPDRTCDDPVVYISINNGAIRGIPNGQVLGPTCLDITKLDRNQAVVGDYILVAYIN